MLDGHSSLILSLGVTFRSPSLACSGLSNLLSLLLCGAQSVQRRLETRRSWHTSRRVRRFPAISEAHRVLLLNVQVPAEGRLLIQRHQGWQVSALVGGMRMRPVRIALDAEYLTLSTGRRLGLLFAHGQLLRLRQLIVLPSQRVKCCHRRVLAQSLQREPVLATAVVQGGVEAASQIGVVRFLC